MSVFVKLQQSLIIIKLSPQMALLSNQVNEVKHLTFNKLFLNYLIMSINEKNATIKPRNCVSEILSGLFSMNSYQAPNIFTLMFWYGATSLEHVW